MPIEEIVFAAVNEVKINDDPEIDEPNLIISPWNELGLNESYADDEPVQKCGDVIRTLNGKFAFICASCNCQYLDFQLFGDHFHDGHCGNEFDDSSGSSVAGTKKGSILATAESASEHENVEGLEVIENCILAATIQNGKNKTAENPEELRGHDENELIVEKIFKDISKGEESSNDEECQDLSTISKRKVNGPVCARCCRIYRNDSIFRTHLRRYHESALSNTDIKISSILDLEQKLFGLSAKTICRYCDKFFQDLGEFKTHLYDHAGLFTCKYCPKTFTQKSRRDIHIYTHENLRPFVCPHCNKSFANPTNLRNHIKIHLQIKKFICQYCGKGFVKGTDKRIHERIHTNEQPFQCEECGQRFISQTKLTEHIRRHRNIRDFKCSECDKAFYSQYQLRAHMTTHTRVRAFECLKCGKKFLQRKTLSQHMNIHSAVKKYVCQTCGKAFAQYAGWRAHTKTHGEPANKI